MFSTDKSRTISVYRLEGACLTFPTQAVLSVLFKPFGLNTIKMHSSLISTFGYLVLQISIFRLVHAASLNLSPMTVSSHPAASEFSSAHGDVKSRNVQHKQSKRRDTSCPSRKSKKYRFRVKVNQVLEKVEDSAPSGDATSHNPTSVGASTSGDANSVHPASGGTTKSDGSTTYVGVTTSGGANTSGSAPAPGGERTGDATYYGTGLGACGIVSNDGSMIAAASHILFDSFPGATANPNLNPICGRKVRATYEGKSVEVQIVDRCTGCAVHDLDFSPTAFAMLGEMEKGRLHHMKWEWI